MKDYKKKNEEKDEEEEDGEEEKKKTEEEKEEDRGKRREGSGIGGGNCKKEEKGKGTHEEEYEEEREKEEIGKKELFPLDNQNKIKTLHLVHSLLHLTCSRGTWTAKHRTESPSVPFPHNHGQPSPSTAGSWWPYAPCLQ